MVGLVSPAGRPNRPSPPPSNMTMHESDREAVARVLGGDPDAFKVLVDRHGRYLFGVALRLVGQARDAEDVVQDALLKAFRQLGTFEGRSDVRTWLHRITVRCAIDAIRARRPESVLDPQDFEVGPMARPTDAPGPDRLMESGQILERLSGAMTRLTALERAAFTLRHREGLSIQEIGTALGLKTEATKNTVFRAVRKVRAALDLGAQP